jgi:hypothetical protein
MTKGPTKCAHSVTRETCSGELKLLQISLSRIPVGLARRENLDAVSYFLLLRQDSYGNCHAASAPSNRDPRGSGSATCAIAMSLMISFEAFRTGLVGGSETLTLAGPLSTAIILEMEACCTVMLGGSEKSTKVETSLTSKFREEICRTGMLGGSEKESLKVEISLTFNRTGMLDGLEKESLKVEISLTFKFREEVCRTGMVGGLMRSRSSTDFCILLNSPNSSVCAFRIAHASFFVLRSCCLSSRPRWAIRNFL